MTEIFFKCTLNADVVLNSTLATEGNLSSLDYIPGSNFLGIVAAEIYNDNIDATLAYKIFHSTSVRFGDATIYENSIGYPIPCSLFNGKNDSNDHVQFYLHHNVVENSPKNEDGDRIQLKQQRMGYLFLDGAIRRDIRKSFAIKSAQDRETRSSKDGQMFGFESISKGQVFVFSIQFEDDSLIELVSTALIGNKRIGKSKTAEFGQVKIEKIDRVDEIDSFESKEHTLVYAQSNLAFFDKNGQPTFQPTAHEFGFESGEIIWEKSQIRTFSYSPWNFKRNTSNTQRDCIAKGSVFYIDKPCHRKKNSIGAFQSEGLGRIIYNPLFLKSGLNNKTEFFFRTKIDDTTDLDKSTIKSELGKFLQNKVNLEDQENKISNKIHELVYSNEQLSGLKNISSSQWGGIRSIASRSETMDSLSQQLFEPEKGYLTHGVAALKYWEMNKGKNLKQFKIIFDENKDLNTAFIEKFAAEMAKENKRLTKNQQK